MKNTPNTPTFATMFINPNPSKGVVATPFLNQLFSFLKTKWDYKSQLVDSGFEINPSNFTWELYLRFKNKSGFIVFTENNKDITFYVYATENDLDPEIFEAPNVKTQHNLKISQLITKLYKSYLQ